MIFPSFTTTAAKGPPRPAWMFWRDSDMAGAMNELRMSVQSCLTRSIVAQSLKSRPNNVRFSHGSSRLLDPDTFSLARKFTCREAPLFPAPKVEQRAPDQNQRDAKACP